MQNPTNTNTSIIVTFTTSYAGPNGKFEGSSYFTSKVTDFSRKVLTTIFVNPGQCPCKSVKTENDINSSKSIFVDKI